MTYKVVFSPEAESDLLELYLYIAERTGNACALAYIERLERDCKGFEEFPERGTSRDDRSPLADGLAHGVGTSSRPSGDAAKRRSRRAACSTPV